MTKFIRGFRTSLPNGANYEYEYFALERAAISALLYAINKSYTSLISSLLKYEEYKLDAHRILLMAIFTGNLEIIELLIHNGADIHYQEDYLLMYAVMCRKEVILEFLLANGADPNAQNGGALRLDISKGRIHMIRLLIDKGAV